jgi:hypothetical protein
MTIASVPDHLGQAWLQHLRDFDSANADCHFEVVSDAPETSLAEIVDMLRINPAMKLIDVIERKRGG